jgi:hypothetical protein
MRWLEMHGIGRLDRSDVTLTASPEGILIETRLGGVTLTPATARYLAAKLYVLAARVAAAQKDTPSVGKPKATNPEAPPIPEGGDEARTESQAVA